MSYEALGTYHHTEKPNSFTNPPNFALPSFSYFLVLPPFAFILGRIALILQNPLLFTSFFCNIGFAEVTDTRK